MLQGTSSVVLMLLVSVYRYFFNRSPHLDGETYGIKSFGNYTLCQIKRKTRAQTPLQYMSFNYLISSKTETKHYISLEWDNIFFRNKRVLIIVLYVK